MNSHTKDTRPSSPKRAILILILCHLAAALLYGTWYWSKEVTDGPKNRVHLQYPDGEANSLWQKLDFAVFRTLNGTLEDNRPAQTFWAITNNRAFDLVQAALMGLILWFFVLRKRSAEEKLTQIKVGLFVGVCMVTFIQIFHFTLFYFARYSPSLVLKKEAIRLSKLEHVTWSLKDASMHSFPGDHASLCCSSLSRSSPISRVSEPGRLLLEWPYFVPCRAWSPAPTGSRTSLLAVFHFLSSSSVGVCAVDIGKLARNFSIAPASC